MGEIIKILFLVSIVLFLIYFLWIPSTKELKMSQRTMDLIDGGLSTSQRLQKRAERVAERTRRTTRLNEAKQKKQNQRQTAANKKKTMTSESLVVLGLKFTDTQWMLIRVASGVVIAGVAYYVLSSVMHQSTTYILGGTAMGFAIAFVLTNMVMESMAKAKILQMRNDLPDIMDLLVVSVEAGLSFDTAVNRLAETNHTPVMRELMQVQTDISHGMSKKDAYLALEERARIKELRSFASAILQSEEMGVSIKTVLITQADTLRTDRKLRAEEAAAKASTKMLIPMLLLIFPAIFVILLGPAAISVMETL